MTQHVDPLIQLFTAIDSECERQRVWRPFLWMLGARPAEKRRKEYRKRATGAALKAAVKARAENRVPTDYEIRHAIEAEFYGDQFDEEVSGIWIGLIASVIVRLVLEWFLRGKSLEPAQG